MKEHKHADILRALADGHEIQWKYSAGAGGWNELYSAVVMASLVGANAGIEFRIKPEKKWCRVAELKEFRTLRKSVWKRRVETHWLSRTGQEDLIND